MPGRMHRVMITPPQKWGIGSDPVYRYLICCKRCVHWDSSASTRRGVGKCKKGRGSKAGNTLSCDDVAIVDGTEVYLETARLNGEMTKVDIGGDVFYCDAEEVRELYELLMSK